MTRREKEILNEQYFELIDTFESKGVWPMMESAEPEWKEAILYYLCKKRQWRHLNRAKKIKNELRYKCIVLERTPRGDLAQKISKNAIHRLNDPDRANNFMNEFWQQCRSLST